MHAVKQDLVFAFRTLARNPGFAAVAMVTLALGIGANTAIFSVVKSVLLEPLPYSEPGRIVQAWANQTAEGVERFSFRVAEYQSFSEHSEVFAEIGGDFPIGATITGNDREPERILASLTTPGFFEVFGATPMLGRTFTMEDIDAGNVGVAVVAHDFWARRLGAERNAIGSTIIVSGRAVTVLGVLPKSFVHPNGNAEVFIPYTVGTERWIGRWLNIFGKLNRGASPTQAAEELNALVAAEGERERRSAGWTVSVEPLLDTVVGTVRPALLAIFGTVGMVLLIACANVANLSLARTTAREREIAVRMALGASRGKIMHQVLLESVVVALGGGVAGALVAYLGLDALIALAPPDIPRLDAATVDTSVLLFTLGVAVFAGLVFGLAPALHAVRSAPGSSLGVQSRSATSGQRVQRILGILVGAEVALALVLLVGAGLMLKSFARLREVDVGFNPSGVGVIRVALPPSKYGEPHERVAFFDRIHDRLIGLPGVRGVGVGSDLPLSGRGALWAANSEERLRTGVTERIPALQRVVTAGFFDALQIPLLSGRTFTERDHSEAPRVVVVNQTLARQLWPGESAVGKRITSSSEPTNDSWVEVIGVVGDIRFQRIEDDPQPQLYEPYAQRPWDAMNLFIRVADDPTTFLPTARREVHAFDPDVPVYNVTSLQQIVEASIASPRFNLWVFAVFATVALLLASAGIYGVLSFSVSQRLREIGIRMAMGARQESVIGLMVRRGMKWVALGSLAGIIAALAASRVLESLLYGVSSTDALTFASVAVILAGAALAACYLPARRASRVDPVAVLRDE